MVGSAKPEQGKITKDLVLHQTKPNQAGLCAFCWGFFIVSWLQLWHFWQFTSGKLELTDKFLVLGLFALAQINLKMIHQSINDFSLLLRRKAGEFWFFKGCSFCKYLCKHLPLFPCQGLDFPNKSPLP